MFVHEFNQVPKILLIVGKSQNAVKQAMLYCVEVGLHRKCMQWSAERFEGDEGSLQIHWICSEFRT